MTDVLLRDVTMRTHRAAPLAKEGVLVGHNGDRVLMSMSPDQAEFLATVLGGLSPSEDTILRLRVSPEDATVWHHGMVDLLACRAFVESLPHASTQISADFDAEVAAALEVTR